MWQRANHAGEPCALSAPPHLPVRMAAFTDRVNAHEVDVIIRLFGIDEPVIADVHLGLEAACQPVEHPIMPSYGGAAPSHPIPSAYGYEVPRSSHSGTCMHTRARNLQALARGGIPRGCARFCTCSSGLPVPLLRRRRHPRQAACRCFLMLHHSGSASSVPLMPYHIKYAWCATRLCAATRTQQGRCALSVRLLTTSAY